MEDFNINDYQDIEITQSGKFKLISEEELKQLILLANSSNLLISNKEGFTLGGAIKSYRQRKDINQTQLAKIIKITKTSMCRIEKGNFNPDIENLKKICEALGSEFKQIVLDMGYRV